MVPETVVKYISLFAPEMADVDGEVIDLYYEFTKPLVSEKKFGKLYNQALALLICHKLKMTGYGEDSSLGEAGMIKNGFAVASISDGGTSISYASAGQGNLTTDNEYTLTIYGAQFLQLRKTVIVPIVIAGVED